MGWAALAALLLAGVALEAGGVVFEQEYSRRPRPLPGQQLEAPIYVIGLVGQSGSGKSTAAKMLTQKGCELVNADEIGHDSYKKGSECYDKIVSRFGQDVVAPSGEIDRRALGSLVFNDDRNRKALESLVWPEIERRIEKRIQARRDERSRWYRLCGGEEKSMQVGRHVVVLEAAVALEAGWTKFCDEVWVIESPGHEVLKGRLVDKRGLASAEAGRRLDAQKNSRLGQSAKKIQEQITKAGIYTAIVRNAGTLKEYAKEVNLRWDTTSRRAGSYLQRRCFDGQR